MNNILMVLGGIVTSGFVLWFFGRLYIARQAGKIAFLEATEKTQKIYPVWAGLGPFENGAKSARAMQAAWAAVLGPEEAADAEEAFERHVVAYDQGPESWDSLRIDALKKTSSETNDYIIMAKALIAKERLNEG